MAKTKDIRAVVDVYEKDGEQKKVYRTIGALFEGERGMAAKLDMIPVGQHWDGWIYFNDPVEVQKENFNEGMKMARETLQQKAEVKDDDIPF